MLFLLFQFFALPNINIKKYPQLLTNHYLILSCIVFVNYVWKEIKVYIVHGVDNLQTVLTKPALINNYLVLLIKQ